VDAHIQALAIGPMIAGEQHPLVGKSMIAYSGKYRIEGNDFVTTVDVSWNEAWNGTEQRRHCTLDGDKLMIVSAPQPSTVFVGKTSYDRLV
jgi:hypothetical protein